MPSKFRVRGLFRRVVLWISRPLAKAGVRPDSITYISLLFALLAFISLPITESSLLYGCFVFITGLLDGVDGSVARLTGTSSEAGALIDSVIDKVAEVLILSAIAVAFQFDIILGIGVPLWVLFAIFGWIMTSYTRARAQSLGVSDLDIGLGGRSERLLTLVVFSVIGLIHWGLVLVTLMGLATAAYRLYHYRQQLTQLEA